jgi:hypothetical protein
MVRVNANGVTIKGIRFVNNTTIEGIAALLVVGGAFELSNCIVSDCWQGLVIGNTLQTFCDIKITNNQFTNMRGAANGFTSSGDAILLVCCENVFVDGNSISAGLGTPRSGIRLGGALAQEDITLMPPTNTSHMNTITNNRVVGNWECAISSVGKGCLIVNNMAEDCNTIGIFARGERITVHDNVVKMAGNQGKVTSGIQFCGVSDGSLAKNVITGTAKCGIVCSPSQIAANRNVSLHGNSIEGNFMYGVYVESSSLVCVEYNRVLLTQTDTNSGGESNNVVSLSTYQSIPGTAFVFTGSTVELHKNVVSKSRVGYDTLNASVVVTDNNFAGCEITTIASAAR